MADTQLGLYVICAGMGGNNAGEIAGALAVRTIHLHLAETAKQANLPLFRACTSTMPAQTNRLANAVHAANQAIYLESERRPDYAGMGTTVIAALLHEEVLTVAHVGDSRLYLIRNATIQPLTTDHSWVAEQILKGLLTEEEAARSPGRNIVTRALGIERSVDVELAEVPVKNGDRLLLCSDGLTRAVHRNDILHILSGSEDLASMSDRLIAMANEAGGDGQHHCNHRNSGGRGPSGTVGTAKTTIRRIMNCNDLAQAPESRIIWQDTRLRLLASCLEPRTFLSLNLSETPSDYLKKTVPFGRI